MNSKLQKKADGIVDNFPALKLFSYFGKEKIIEKLREETRHLSGNEVKTIRGYLMGNLSPNDYKLFCSYLAEAMEKR